MLKIIDVINDSLFPPRDTELTVRGINDSNFPRVEIQQYHSIVYITDYTDPRVQALVIENKYHNNAAAAKILSKIVMSWLDKQPGELILIAIPLSNKRKRERGYNQVEKIIPKLNSHHSTDNSLLSRTKDTAPQTTLKKDARRKNIVGAFSCPHPELLHNYVGKTIVLIDDVTTTGATLEVARATLAPHLPHSTKLICLALAH